MKKLIIASILSVATLSIAPVANAISIYNGTNYPINITGERPDGSYIGLLHAAPKTYTGILGRVISVSVSGNGWTEPCTIPRGYFQNFMVISVTPGVLFGHNC